MKKAKFIIIFLVVLAFILVPFPAADLYIRVHFTETGGDSCSLYYTTTSNPVYTGDQCITSAIDYDLNQVTFCLDASLEKELTGLRLDFPGSGNLIGIDNITVSSAGIIQKQFNPCKFFADENIIQKNDIPEISLVTARNRAYLLPGTTDPYVVLSPALTAEITDGYSHLRLTRLSICLFVVACVFFYRKNLFSGTAEQ